MRNSQLFRQRWFISTFLFLPAFGFAQVTREWVATFNGPGNGEDIARSVAVDVAGNVYVTGQSQGAGTGLDYATIKYNAAGVQLWAARYNGPGNNEDAAKALVIDDAGNVYITGRSIGIGTSFDFATIKYDNNGNALWIRRFNSIFNGFDEATAIGLDRDGNVYVTGFGATIKYDNNGAPLWVFTHSVNSQSLALDNDGNVYITGYRFTSFASFDYATMKFNTNGNHLWFRIYHAGNSDIAWSLALDEDRNVYVTGQSDGIGTSKDIVTVKYDTDGNEQWVARFNNSPVNGWDEALAITTDDKGHIYVTGQSDGSGSAEDYITLKYNSNGEQQWEARYNGPDNVFDRASSIKVDGEGNVYITGFSSGTGMGHDIATIKYNQNGQEQWVDRYNGTTANGHDGAFSLALDASGNVYVTGQSANIGTGFDYTTIKYSQPSHACGNNGDKVLVCHKGKKTLCISEADVSAHIAHGDHMGECPEDDAVSVGSERRDLSGLTRELPARFQIFNAPNPVSAITRIYYELPFDGYVSLQVYDMMGRQITTLVNGGRKAGYHTIYFDASALPKGVYYYRITLATKTKGWVQTKKMYVVN
jgi:uncharacterized delta-60 repeat protein